MAVLDFAHREITAKVVYFGAADAGVSTNVEQLAASVPAAARSDVQRFGPEGSKDPSVCFEYLPADTAVLGFPLRLLVFGVPGGLHHGSLRRSVLEGLDAVVFVADARPDRDQTNVESLLDLEQLLREQELELASVPVVLQVNHTDASAARDPAQVVVDLNPYGFQVQAAVARTGEGVLETHHTALDALVDRLARALRGERSPVRVEAMRRERRESIGEQIERLLSIYRTETARAARDADPRVRFAGLPVSETFSVPYQPRELRGTRPTHVLGARLDGADIVLELVHERINGGHPRRIRVTLENRPMDEAAPRLPTFAAQSADDTDPTASLPDRVVIVTPPPTRDWPPVLYGVIGTACGLLIGLLLGVLLFL